MSYALYPGCTVLGRVRNYEMAAREVAKVLGIEFIDVPYFECCGFPVKSVHYETFLMMAAHNILVAEERGLDICTLCSACTSSLTEVNRHLIKHFDEKTRIVALFNKQGFEHRMGRNIVVKHFAKILYEDIGPDEIKKRITKRLSNLNVAPHYGCHYLKPTDIYENPEDPENPHSLDELIRVTGAQSVSYQQKMRCCGAGVLAVNEDLAFSIARPKLQELSKNSADALVLICPFCGVMYDDNQRKIGKKVEEEYCLPVLYYPQLLGLALGIEHKRLGFNMNKVKVHELLAKIG
jgi:heterodisulfide reductase subunit B